MSPAGTSTSVRPRARALRVGRVSGRWYPRTLVVLLLAALLAGVAAGVGLAAGDYPLAPARLVAVLTGGGDAPERLVVMGVRLPRVVLAVIVGASLAVAGALVQTTTRNGLASPDLLGITAGAGTGAVAVLVLGGGGGAVEGALQLVGAPLAALVGGLVAAAVVAAVLRVTGAGGVRALLVGVATSATFGGLTSWMLLAADVEEAARANAWLTGSLTGRGWAEVGTVAVVLLLCTLALIPLATRLPALELGGDVARALGHDVARVTTAVLGVAVVLTSVAASAVGPIGFVALVAPHLARLACAAPRPPLLVSAVMGACLLLLSDLVARLALAPFLLPTGAVTALVGAPFLIWLLVRAPRGPAL